MSTAARYLRQILLPQVGQEGQSRIEAAVARLEGESLAHEIACMYARGAGFSATTPGPIDTGALAPAGLVRAPEARETLAGARAALAEIRCVLAIETPRESS